jgi:hypothetical protein
VELHTPHRQLFMAHAIISPSLVRAVTARQDGRLLRSIKSEWYRVAVNGLGIPLKRSLPS